VDGEIKQDLFNATEELSRHCEELQELQLGLRSSLKILKIDELFRSRRCILFINMFIFTCIFFLRQSNK
jgi:hypothetical protein